MARAPRYTDAAGFSRSPLEQAPARYIVAIRIARKYRDTAPTVDQLIRDFGMSRPTAYRWRCAYRDELEKDGVKG